MKILTIEHKGKEYKFETNNKTVKLHLAIEDVYNSLRFVCTYENKQGLISPFTINTEGNPQLGHISSIDFTIKPYDKLKEIKRVFREGALIEFHIYPHEGEWRYKKEPSFNADQKYYRLKDGFTIEEWDDPEKRKIIQAYWNGEEIEFNYKLATKGWNTMRTGPRFDPDFEYRVKQKEMKRDDIYKNADGKGICALEAEYNKYIDYLEEKLKKDK